MDSTDIIGIGAAALTTIANFPQAYIIIREKSTHHVSVSTYGLLLSGTVLWVIYGIIKTDYPIIIANGISTITCIIIVVLKIISNRTIAKIHKAILPKKLQKR